MYFASIVQDVVPSSQYTLDLCDFHFLDQYRQEEHRLSLAQILTSRYQSIAEN